ncbi:18535_t:CDS:2, partial [Dentiscutata erythropus]
CNYKTTCKCPAKHPSGTFCSGEIGCNKNNAYECPIPGFTTCEYGPRDSCKLCGKLVCTSQPPLSTPKPLSTTICKPACIKPNSCVNAKCVCQSSNCPKGQTCDSKRTCAVSQIPVNNSPKPKCSDTKTRNIVEQVCEAISSSAKPISSIGNLPLDALEAFGACEEIIAGVSAAAILTGIGALATFGGGQAVCIAIAEAVIVVDLESALCSTTWQKFCQI